MSGDVQPRKRKDKKRKKDESSEQVPTQPQIPLITSKNESEDVNIHVHKEEGTGGGICAKIIFFLLFSALAVLIGLIITEHRGLTDLDTVDQESRFSQIFEGWTDNTDHDHEDEADHIVSSLEDHDDHEDDHEDDHDDNEDESPEALEDDEHEHEEEDEEEQEQDDELSDEGQDEEEEEEEQDDEDAEQAIESEEPDENDEGSEDKDVDEDEPSEESVDEDEEEQVSKDVEEEDEEEEEEPDEIEEDDAESKDEPDNLDQSEEKGSEETQNEPEEEHEVIEDQKEVDEEEKPDQDDENENNYKSVNVGGDNEAEESESDKQSDVDYEYENITSKADFPIKEQIDEAQKSIKKNAAYAIKLFDVLLQNHPTSPRSIYGKAQALDVLAEQNRSNDILLKAIAYFSKILELENVPDALFQAAGERCVERMRFIGYYDRAIGVHLKLIARFPLEIKYRNELVVNYLILNRVKKARLLLQETLSSYPDDGFALVHYGFILKTTDNNLNESVSYLQRGIATRAPGVVDGRFYFHLGDALARLGRLDEAMAVYEEGVEFKLFLSKYQRSLYNVDRLKGKPWWNKRELPYTNLFVELENNWMAIRDEGLSVLKQNGLFEGESENLKDTGDWKQFELFARGRRNDKNCKKCPFTCKLIEKFPDVGGCKRGQTKFSVMHPGTHVWPHCGPTNCRLRIHLGLKVPDHTYIRVANETRSWENGKVLIFDDSFEHEVWHNGTTLRLVLIVDVWHPELTSAEKFNLPAI